MNEVKCVIEGCKEVFKTEEAVSPKVRFVCKNHPRAHQLAAVGRSYKSDADTRDTDVHFQTHQFDKKL